MKKHLTPTPLANRTLSLNSRLKLDILAFGGGVSILFFLPLLIIISRNLFLPLTKNYDLRGWFALFVLIDIMIMFINPILSVPKTGFFFWMSLGLIAGFQPLPLYLFKENFNRK